ncbi:hypothetical protein F4778DRAFT_713403, partial [Xylariomycetidae sp. FL2044]
MNAANDDARNAAQRARRAAEYYERVRESNLGYQNYRESGTFITRSNSKAALDRVLVPNPRALEYFRILTNWRRTRLPLRIPRRIDGPRLPAGTPDSTLLAQQYYRNLPRTFGAPPRYQLRRALGYGGQGVAALYQDVGGDGLGKDIVVKKPLSDEVFDSNLLDEENSARKMRRSAHLVQLLEPDSVRQRYPRRFPAPLDMNDSSIDERSSGSGDEGARRIRTRADPLKRPYPVPRRATRPAAHWVLKRRRKQARLRELKRQIDAESERPNEGRRNFLVFEYLENGDLATLLGKLAVDFSTGGRIPNRVLWAIWLCFVRACVGMEYPPRKHHPDRKTPDATSRIGALRNHFYRDLKNLGLPVLTDEQLEAKSSLIEEIPADPNAKRYNFVHMDIDPSNIFIGGLELADADARLWNDADDEYEDEEIPYTARRHDRVKNEHAFMPIIKLGDYGHAEVMKFQKRNIYYLDRRDWGKHGMYSPEQFCPEWDRIPANANGSEVADSTIAGAYTYKTNLWGIALTMWQVITQLRPPRPPQPHLDPINHRAALAAGYERARHDEYIAANPGLQYWISYCPLFQDADGAREYNWVDRDLRQTIINCMKHMPADRPDLPTLLEQAKAGVNKQFQGEDDAFIRAWVRRWLYEPPPGQPIAAWGIDDGGSDGGSNGGPDSAPRLDSAPRAGPSRADPRPEADELAGARDNEDHPIRLQLQIQFNARFPNGYDRIPNAAPNLECGLYALHDSLVAQLPLLNGNAGVGLVAPTVDALGEWMADLEADGRFLALVPDQAEAPGEAQENNFWLTQLSVLLNEWGLSEGISLQLGYLLPGRRPLYEPTQDENADTIWIYNNNVVGVVPGARYNHYEGIRRRPPPDASGRGADSFGSGGGGGDGGDDDSGITFDIDDLTPSG